MQTVAESQNVLIWDSQNFGISSGVLTRLWIATNGTSVGGLSIVFDNASSPQIGSNASPLAGVSGMNNIGLGCNLVFSNGETGAPFHLLQQGVTSSNLTNNGGGVGGYFAIKAPFASRCQIYMLNTSTNSNLTYWIQPFIETLQPSFSLPPLRLHCATFYYRAPFTTQIYPLLSLSGPNGVYLKAIRTRIAGTSGNWWE